MLVGCVSDTHLSGRPVPPGILDALEGCDLILHAGDILDLSVLDRLSTIAETIAVRGNMDRGETAARLPDRRIVEAGGFRIGLAHGSGSPVGLAGRVASLFEGDGCDCIVFGHSHKASNETRDGILLFNPGSPTDRIFARHNTVGMLELGDSITGRIIDIGRLEGR